MGNNINLYHEYIMIKSIEIHKKLIHYFMDRVYFTSKKLFINLDKDEDYVFESF